MKKLILVATSILVISIVAFLTPQVGAVTVDPCDTATGTATANSILCNSSGSSAGPSLEQIIKNIINILLYFVGVVAVAMIVWSGFRYITSAGNAQQVTSAKNTLLYAVIGVLIAFFSYAIVNWVIKWGDDPSSVTGSLIQQQERETQTAHTEGDSAPYQRVSNLL